jgi:hypothetical protein
LRLALRRRNQLIDGHVSFPVKLTVREETLRLTKASGGT